MHRALRIAGSLLPCTSHPAWQKNLCSLRCTLVVGEEGAHEIRATHPTTPDGRYFVVKGKL